MLTTSFKIALRGFIRNKIFSAFNLLSLVVGLFVVWVAISYVNFEYSYDKFHKGSENSYRLARTYRSQDYSVLWFDKWNDSLASEQLNAIKGLKNVPGVKTAAQFITSENLEFIDWENKRIQERGFLTTNTPGDFVSVFTWKPIAGSLEAFGENLNKVILTKSTALKLLGSEVDFSKLIGKNLKIMAENYTVSTVIEDVPKNSHFDFNIALSKPRIDYWGSRIYLGLQENADDVQVAEKINAAMASIAPSLLKDVNYKNHFLQPIRDIHLKSNILYELKTPGNYNFIVLIVGFAIFILLITLFNYANFTLAIKSKQGKAIGIKKAMGAKNTSVAWQFLLEGVLLSLLSLPVLAVLMLLLVPYFNELMGVAIPLDLLEEPKMLLTMIGLSILTGILASIAPALLFSNKSTLSLFKDNLRDNRFEHFSIRKYLVISQFAVLIVIISVSYFINSQMNFIAEKDLGFTKEGILYAYTSEENQDVFQERLRQIPEIKFVGNGSTLGVENYNQGTYKLQGVDEVFDDANQLYLDYEALRAYGIKSTLAIENRTDRTTLINRTAAEKFAKVKNVSPEELVGTVVVTEPEYISEEGQVGFPFTIGGVFEDINLFSLKEKVTPYFITISPNIRMNGRSIIAFDDDKSATVLNKIQAVHNELNESVPLETNFLSDNLAGLYEQEQQALTLVFYLNLLAVFLSALGIVGITLFLVLARKKEIGIRKVLGASDAHIMKTTIQEYVYFVVIALLIGWPIAYYGSSKWLNGFAYRVTIGQYIFLLVGLLVFIGTAILVGLVALNAAQKKPVKSLRTE